MVIAVALASGAGLLWPTLQKAMSGAGVSNFEATRLINDRNAVVLDVRSSDEFARGHVAGARNIPAEQLASRIGDVHKNKATPVVVVCANGQRAVRVAEQLKTAGYAEAVVLEGGIAGWTTAGLPLAK